MERISSPEQLDQYLKTSNPGLWFILTGILVLLCGAIVWSFYGRLDTKLVCGSRCQDGNLEVYFWEGNLKDIEKGMTVQVDGVNYTIESISTEPVEASSLGKYILETGQLDENEWVYSASTKTDLEDGSYKAEIIIESVAPKKFFLN